MLQGSGGTWSPATFSAARLVCLQFVLTDRIVPLPCCHLRQKMPQLQLEQPKAGAGYALLSNHGANMV